MEKEITRNGPSPGTQENAGGSHRERLAENSKNTFTCSPEQPEQCKCPTTSILDNPSVDIHPDGPGVGGD